MLTYTPGETVVHRLDPRTKLGFQFAFALVAFTAATPARLAGLFAVGLGVLYLAGGSLRQALRAYWFVLLVLALGPLIAGLTLGPPWFRVAPAVNSARSVARVVPILLVSTAYITATPIRATRAAIQHTLPGRPGRLIGVGVALTFRYVPVLRADLGRVLDAIAARGGDTRPLGERVRRIVSLTLVRAFRRSDRLAVALQARCFAWNPTLPRLRFTRLDLPVWGVSFGLVAVALAELLPF